MINVDDVKDAMAALGNYNDDKLERYSALIECAASVVSSMLKEESLCKDSRAIFLAAAKANYDAALSSSCADRVTSFTAGDISISESTSSVDNAKALFDDAKLNCALLIVDDSFAFLGV
ncbi:MAG: hypothetical protein ACLUFN_02650 [Eubacterium sp.]